MNPDFNISQFMTAHAPLSGNVQRNICRSVVNTWDDYLDTKLGECKTNTLKNVYKDNLHQLLFDKLKIDEGF